MLTVLDYLEIRKAHAAGESMRSIARRLDHCQKSVRRPRRHHGLQVRREALAVRTAANCAGFCAALHRNTLFFRCFSMVFESGRCYGFFP